MHSHHPTKLSIEKEGALSHWHGPRHIYSVSSDHLHCGARSFTVEKNFVFVNVSIRQSLSHAISLLSALKHRNVGSGEAIRQKFCTISQQAPHVRRYRQVIRGQFTITKYSVVLQGLCSDVVHPALFMCCKMLRRWLAL